MSCRQLKILISVTGTSGVRRQKSNLLTGRNGVFQFLNGPGVVEPMENEFR